MLTPSQFDVVEEWLGVPLSFYVPPTAEGATGWVRTAAPRAAAGRGRASSMGAAEPAQIAHDLCERLRDLDCDAHLHFAAEASPAVEVAVHLSTSHGWLDALTLPDRCIRDRVAVLPADAKTAPYGADNARWAWLRGSSGSPHVEWGKPGVNWSGRTDANPLAALRHAHARAVVTLRTDRDQAQPPLSRRPEPSRPPRDHEGTAATLRQQLALLPQAARQAERTHRARPLVVQVEAVASATLLHTQTTGPGGLTARTDVHALSAARRVMVKIADAAGVAMPVPF